MIEVVDAPTRLIKVSYECNLDDYVFHWKWSYLWQWRRCFNRWRFCRDMNKAVQRMADEIREEVDKQIIESLTGNPNGND